MSFARVFIHPFRWRSRQLAIYESLNRLEKKINELEQRLDERLLKLERIERLTERVTKDRVHRTRNFSEFRKAIENQEEPLNASGR